LIENKKPVLAVVTARAGSSFVGKNYKEILGFPLFMWSVKAALKSSLVDYVIVSSNCPHVKELTKKLTGENDRVEFVDRPDSISGPDSKNEEALLHAVEAYEDAHSDSPGYIVNLQPTSPLRLSGIIDDMLEGMSDCKKFSALTVSEHTPLFLQKTEDGIKWHYDIYNRPMRQSISDFQMYLHDDGNIYITALNVLCETMCRLDKDPFVYVNDRYCSLQVDSPADFAIIEGIMSKVRKGDQYV